MSEVNYKFYVQPCDKYGDIIEGSSEKSIEEDFNVEGGFVRYKECKGLNTIGSAVVYTESYADSERLRVHVPSNLVHKPTTVTLTLYFIGENRHNVYEEFYKYVSNGKILYHDTKRKKYAYLILIEATSPKEDNYKGSLDYTVVDFKFQNLWGECKDQI